MDYNGLQNGVQNGLQNWLKLDYNFECVISELPLDMSYVYIAHIRIKYV